MSDLYRKPFVILGVGVLVFLIAIPKSFSQSSSELISPARRVELEQQLNDLQSQIDAQQKMVDQKEQESASLQRDIDVLNGKINEAKLAIKARDITIEQLSSDISGKQDTIGQLNDKLEKEKESLAQLIRKTQEIDSYSLAEFVLGSSDLSTFFGDLDSFDQVKKELYQSFSDIGDTRMETEQQKQDLEDRRQEQLNLRGIQDLQKKTIEKQQAERNNLLKITKGEEKIYQQILSQKQKDATTIRTALFSLTGTGAIPFEKAYQYANEAGMKTGLRPAFILGIIAEESNLGENVGTGNWKIDMCCQVPPSKTDRDRGIFRQITSELGLDPDQMPVSKKAWYGYGGAMGPAQFIPSTWIIYKDKIAEVTGSNPPNPWNPRDAFFAAAVLLKDNGGARGTAAAERLAALRYLAGWKNATKSSYAFYGNEVMDLADKYQQQIDILKGLAVEPLSVAQSNIRAIINL
jgi:membrane-bound lytic murein transglycosylase B